MPLPSPVPQLPADLVTGATLLSDREVLLPLLPRNAVICEVGVGVGSFSRLMIDVCEPRHFIAIDQFKIHDQSELWGKPISDWFGTKTHYEFYRELFAAAIEMDRMTVIQGDSDICIGQLDDASVDVIYIDADHGYDAVKRDLAAAVRKVTPDGYIIMNDYVLVDHLGAREPYGVIYATHEFMIEHNWAMQYFALQTSMFCDVVLRRAEVLTPASFDEGSCQVTETPCGFSPRSMIRNYQDVKRLGTENAALRREIAALRASSSWRVTAPLRAVKELIRPVQ